MLMRNSIQVKFTKWNWFDSEYDTTVQNRKCYLGLTKAEPSRQPKDPNTIGLSANLEDSKLLVASRGKYGVIILSGTLLVFSVPFKFHLDECFLEFWCVMIWKNVKIPLPICEAA